MNMEDLIANEQVIITISKMITSSGCRLIPSANSDEAVKALQAFS